MTDNLPKEVKLHSFQEAINNIEAGGSAARYGTFPAYSKGPFGLIAQYNSHSQSAPPFSLEDQKSNDWLLTSPEDFKAITNAQQEWHRKEWYRQYEAEEAAKLSGMPQGPAGPQGPKLLLRRLLQWFRRS